MKSTEYRRVRREEDEEDGIRHVRESSPCLLPCLLLLLITLSLSLALLFFLTAPLHRPLSPLNPHSQRGRNSTDTDNPRDDDKPTTTTISTTTPNSHKHSSGEEERESTTHPPSTTGRTEDLLLASLNNSLLLKPSGNETDEQRNLREQLVALIRKTELAMEKVTGLEGELLIPGFMLLVFLLSVSFVSCCCCLLARRRERRRRELFGKIITDLQTGDSKRVLLNHSDIDD